MIRRLGQVLMMVGVALGVLVGVAWLVRFNVMELPLLVLIGTVKLAIISSIGLIGAGAAILRVANRSDGRLGSGEEPPPHR